ncbi:MAG: 4Fe-4S dicluster domain-containing protein [Chloroflexota bacterium]|nr:MAG: 4Fe-4S dicluster domain-containing protein [Chloroflexota bacterium]
MSDFEQIRAQAQEAWKRLQDSPRPRIIVAMGSCGIAAGADVVLETIRDEVKKQGIAADIMSTGCMGMCYEEPLVDIIKPGQPRISYRKVTPETARELVRDVVAGSKYRQDLAFANFGESTFHEIPSLNSQDFYRIQVRRLLQNTGEIDPENIDHYLARGGYAAFNKALTSMTPEEVIAEVKTAVLNGRGGAAYPAGLKWESCRKAPGYPKYIICNADEGIPGVFVDRFLLEGDPHAVIEGMLIAAYAVGSDIGYIYIRTEYPLGAERFATAIKQAEERGLLGRNILGTDFTFRLEIRRGAGSYVAGESSALMSSIEGGRAMPRLKRPRSVEKGLWAKPTSMNNVETFANVPWIINNGGAWYKTTGSEGTSGTSLFSISGKIVRTGILEVPFGLPLRAVIDAAGGVPEGHQLKAVMPDGPSGGLIPAKLLDTILDLDAFKKIEAPLGAGGLVILDETVCLVDLMRWALAFNMDESCGRCTLCRIGCQRLHDLWVRVGRGEGTLEDLDKANMLQDLMRRMTHCGLGQAAGNPVRSALKHFRAELEAHIVEKRCPSKVCPSLTAYRIDPAKCSKCGVCEPACPSGAISRDGRLTINQDKCIHCDICVELCPDAAVVIDKAERPPARKPAAASAGHSLAAAQVASGGR